MADFTARDELIEAVLGRAVAPGGIDEFERLARSAHHCSHPVRLYGSQVSVDADTGEITSGEACDERLFMKACGNRRKSRCLACADVYRHDARHLVMAGLAGGKDVPESVATHPMAFLTLTMPSFGLVHTRSKSGPGPCHPSSPSKHCPHGKANFCFSHHGSNDPLVGQPLCDRCYRYSDHVVAHGLVGELWRRTTIYMFRALARVMRTTPTELSKTGKLSFVKVVEYQARGAVHLHVVVRVDGAGQEIVPPPSEITTGLLAVALEIGARAVRVPHPVRLDGIVHHARWGEQLDVSPIDSPAAARRAARYVSKYVSASTESTGALDRRLKNASEVASLKRSELSPHHRRLVECAWRLGGKRELAGLGLRRSAHALGFNGHCLTKSRRYSVTLSQLRNARYEHRRQQAARYHGETKARDPGQELVIGHWRYGGIGYGLLGDHLVAEMYARNAIDNRRNYWEWLSSAPLEAS